MAKADDVYHLGTDPDEIADKWYAMRADLREHPVGRIGPDEFDDTQVVGGYNALRWPRLATVLSAYTNSRDTAPLVTAYERYAAPDPSDDSFDLYNAVMCADSKWPRSFRYWREDQAEVNEKPPSTPTTTCGSTPAASSGRSRQDTAPRSPERTCRPPCSSRPPTTRPPRTRAAWKWPAHSPPPAWSSNAAAEATPSPSLSNKCLDDLLIDYLRTGKVPADRGLVDRTCAKNPDPTPIWVAPALTTALRTPATAVPRQFTT